MTRGGREESRSYYGRPIVKAPVWTWEIPWYVFVGGLAGVSSLMAALATATGRPALARSARRVSAAGALVSPALLISDLGRPERFHHMLRVFKPTSPMSMGSWTLAVFGPAAVGSAALAELGWLPRLQRTAAVAAAVTGPVMATYTGVLFADTSIPVWREARRELPLVFGASSLAAAGAAASLLTSGDEARPARHLAMTGAAITIAAGAAMERRLGELARPYREATAGRLARTAKTATATGAALLAASELTSSRHVAPTRHPFRHRIEPTRHPFRHRVGRSRRVAGAVGGALLIAGSACERWAVFRAGHASAADPAYLVDHQRDRMAARP